MTKSTGGSAIAAGSYGCIFKPPLKCKDGREGYENGVSKLLEKDAAREEMQVFKLIMPIIKKIKNNEHYFIPNSTVPFYDCEMGDVSDEDLQNSKVCKNIEYIREYPGNEERALKYIKSRKPHFGLIQQAYGGMDLNDFIQKKNRMFDPEFLKKLNDNICDLIKNGVVIMNKKGLLL